MIVRVLLVDDHMVVRAGLKALLESTGRIDVVGEASSGEEAVGKARILEPDIVIMDLAMPGMDGVHATRRITELGLEASPDFSHEPVGGGWAGDLASRREWRGHYEAEYRAVIVGCGAERRPGRGVRGGGGSRRGERADRSLRRGEAAGVTVRGWRFLPG